MPLTMSAPRRLPWIACALGLLGVALGCSRAPRAPARPNLIVIVADDLGFADVGWQARDDGAVRTPNLDRLARESLRFSNYVTAPMCSPARAGLLTGRNPLRMGLSRNVRRADTFGLPAGERTLTEDLRAAGYATRLVGKWHLGHADPSLRPLGRGFEHHYGFLGGWIDYSTHRRGEQLDWQRDGADLVEPGYATHLLAEEAVRALVGRDRARPFFLLLAFGAPHAPIHLPPGRDPGEIPEPDPKRRHYLLMVSELDRAVGRVLDALRAEGLERDTLVFFASDNGGDPTYGASNAPHRGGKYEVWEGGIRAPALLRWPAALAPGDWPHFTTFLDVAPTLASALGVTLSRAADLDGRDLLPALRAGSALPPAALAVGSERLDELRLAVTDGVRKQVLLVERPAGLERRFLYDLEKDPTESSDASSTFPAPWYDEVPALRLDHWRSLPRIPAAREELPR